MKPVWLMYNCRFGIAIKSRGVGLGPGEFLPWACFMNLARGMDDNGTFIILTYGIDALTSSFLSLEAPDSFLWEYEPGGHGFFHVQGVFRQVGVPAEQSHTREVATRSVTLEAGK